MAGVQLRGVEKSFGDIKVIREVSFDIADGEFVVLVGPSGCGKSTLLRMIAGLESISGGEIAIGGNVVNRLAPKDRNIAMVFQSYALYPHKTVYDNMAFSLRLSRTPTAEVDDRVQKAAHFLGLSALLSRYPKELSGGQRQRVAMGRAIVRNPEVFLFDEPLSNLDAKLRVQVRTEIKDQHQRLRTTSIYVTHDQIEAMTMADKIVVMRDGIIEQIGSPLDLYDRPDNIFVAGFIGSPSMNFIPGRLVDCESGRTSVELRDGSRIQVGSFVSASVREVIVGVRPEDILLGGDGDELRSAVTVVEPTGADTLVFAGISGTDICTMLRERQSYKPGDDIRLSFRPEAIHLFEAATGKRIN